MCTKVRAGEPRLTLLAGEAGIGRSTVLEAIADKLTGTGTRVLTVRLSENDTAGHYGLLYRLLAELELSEEHPSSITTSENSKLGLVARLSADDHDPSSSTASAQLAGILASTVRRHLPLTVLVDDAQWADIGTVSLLDQFIRQFTGPGCTVVATWRCWPPTGPDDHQRATTMHRLVADGAARVITMRPLVRAETTALISASVRAVPDPELVDRLHTDSRGNPAALNSEIEAQLKSGALRVVDRHAYSQRTIDPLPLSEQHPLLAAIRDSGTLCWSVARTMTVLAPLGDAAAGLVAEALEIDSAVAHASLRSLETGRVLVGSPKAGWKFRTPVVRQALEASLGPYEQQRLSALAVRAVWDGIAEPADETFLPDQLVAAGRLVDPERSTDELLAGSEAVMFTDGARAVRWLRALVDRVHEPDKRSMALLSHSAACAIHNRLEESVDSARAVLVEYAEHLSAETLQETELVYVLSLAACGQRSELNRLAAREISLSGGPANELVTRAFALLFLGRYTDGDELLRVHQRSWTTANPVTADLGHIYRGGAGVLTGDPSLLRLSLADPRSWRSRDHPRHRFEQIRYEVDMLLMLGERDEATRVLRANDVSVEQLHNTERSLLRLLRGEHSAALDMARRSIAEGGYSTRPLVPVVMARGAAGVLIGRGWLTRARELTDMARGMHLDHLLDHADVKCLRALGEPENADELLRSALHSADENGFVLGTEHMWADLAVREHALGNHEQAVRCVHRAQGVAEALGTHRAKLTYLVSRARVYGDRAAGRTAVRRARERAIPDESAWVFTSVALCGIDTKRLLSDAYVLLGELDALLWRAQQRGIMRAHHVSVPGRSITTAENERLLAVLVTEGLTNRQLALLFGTSEKSVESRLNRMFARTGHRSRVELAAAMLTDEYRG